MIMGENKPGESIDNQGRDFLTGMLGPRTWGAVTRFISSLQPVVQMGIWQSKEIRWYHTLLQRADAGAASDDLINNFHDGLYASAPPFDGGPIVNGGGQFQAVALPYSLDYIAGANDSYFSWSIEPEEASWAGAGFPVRGGVFLQSGANNIGPYGYIAQTSKLYAGPWQPPLWVINPGYKLTMQYTTLGAAGAFTLWGFVALLPKNSLPPTF